jgi:hypothetical protein
MPQNSWANGKYGAPGKRSELRSQGRRMGSDFYIGNWILESLNISCRDLLSQSAYCLRNYLLIRELDYMLS